MEEAKGQMKFSYNLYQQLSLANGADKNVCFSPLSVYVALAMIQLGAKGNTDKQLRAVLGMNLVGNEIPEEFHVWLKNALHNLKPNSDLKLYFANKICIRKGIPLMAEFSSSLTDLYSTDVSHYDFTTNKQQTCDEINEWIKKLTNGKITQLLTPAFIDADTLIILLTAIYMNAKWFNQFLPHKTKAHPFHLNDNTIVEVQMMEQTATFQYTHNPMLKCRALELPYLDNNICMYIILPDNLHVFEKTCKHDNLIELINNLKDSYVNVKLPKFEIESTFSLKEALSNLGLNEVFSQETADFSGVSAANATYVSSFVHKCTLDVTEVGTEAAAASAVSARNRRSVPSREIIEFFVDRPFLYLIRDNRSGLILFFGRLSQPKNKVNIKKAEL